MENASAADNIKDYLQNARLHINYDNFLGQKTMIFTVRKEFYKPPLIQRYNCCNAIDETLLLEWSPSL
jgi:hypothetical protein